MLDYLLGTYRGNKLAASTSDFCRDIVNILIKAGFEISLPDTAYILGECYAICSQIMMKPGMSDKQTGTIVVVAQSHLKKWLYEVFQESDKNYDFQNSVESVIAGLPNIFERWVMELIENHREFKGQNYYNWIPFGVVQFCQHLDFYIYNKFGNNP